jgi:hypothetical protein
MPQDYGLKVLLLYQDEQTRSWANEVYSLAEQVVGEQCIHPTWLNLREFRGQSVPDEAATRLLKMDVWVVAVRAGEELPFAFHRWADMLSSASAQAHGGALVALIGLPERPMLNLDRTRQELEGLSQRCGLEFMVRERRLPANLTPAVSSRARATDGSGSEVLGYAA